MLHQRWHILHKDIFSLVIFKQTTNYDLFELYHPICATFNLFQIFCFPLVWIIRGHICVTLPSSKIFTSLNKAKCVYISLSVSLSFFEFCTSCDTVASKRGILDLNLILFLYNLLLMFKHKFLVFHIQWHKCRWDIFFIKCNPCSTVHLGLQWTFSEINCTEDVSYRILRKTKGHTLSDVFLKGYAFKSRQ